MLIALIIISGATYAISGKQSDVRLTKQSDLKKELEKKDHKLKQDSDNLPVVDYEPLPPDNSSKQAFRQQAIRYIRNARYDGYPVIIKDEDGEEVVLHTHSMGDFPPIPTQKSDAVVIGVITDTQAFLSNDNSIVYSEYAFQIKEVLKGISQPPVSSAGSLTIERLGGAVRFPSGRTRKFREYSFGTPIKGHEYIFFLTYNNVGQTFSLLTAYELSNGRAIALDNAAQFSEYKDVPDEVILNAVRESMK
jgi:hypothetical protein